MRSRSVDASRFDGELAEAHLREFALRAIGLGKMVQDFCLALDSSSPAELYDDPQDPLGRMSRLVADLELIADVGSRYAGEEHAASPARQELTSMLTQGAARLSRELPSLSSLLDRHLSIQARRSPDRTTTSRSTVQ